MFSIISIIWGYYTEYHRLCGLNSRNLFMAVLEARKSELRAPVHQVLVGPSPWSEEDALSPCPHRAAIREGGKHSRVSPFKGTHPTYGVSLSGCG